MKVKFFIVILLVLSILLVFNKGNDNKVLKNNKENLNKTLAVLLEQEDGSYKEVEDNAWNKEKYVFNEDLSYCENGSKLAWNNITKKINLNINKSDRCYVYYDVITFADYIKSLYTKDGVNNLYYHDGEGEYANVTLETGDNSYRFAGGDYHLTKLSLDQSYNSIYDVISLKLSNGDIHKNNYWWGTGRSFYLAYQDDQTSTSLKTLLTKAIEDGYIEKDEVNNYVCFGSSEKTCPKENLYRIIGVFDGQIKLIKAVDANKEQLGDDRSFYAPLGHDATYIGDSTYDVDGYYWNKEGSGKQAAWADSSLNNVNLNTNFVDYLTKLEDGKWIKKIADTSWQVGGMTYQNGYTKGAKTAYDYELGNSKNQLTETKKIGLMYVSDYYYAAPEKYWPLKGYDGTYQDVTIENSTDYRGAIWDNWLWDGNTEWLITPRADYLTGGTFRARYDGTIYAPNVGVDYRAVRPCFYLNFNVEYVSGDGTLANPYRIN